MLRQTVARASSLVAPCQYLQQSALVTTLTCLREFTGPFQLLPAEQRHSCWPSRVHSTSAAQHTPSADAMLRQGEAEGAVVYEGPLAATLYRLKVLSLCSGAAAVLGSPVMLALDSSAGVGLGGKAALAATLSSFGVFTTVLLHWFTGPYVHGLVYEPRSDALDLTTLSFLARRQRTRCAVSEARFPDTSRPQVTFKARGRYFYLDPDAFPDLDLLDRLSPPDPAQHPPDKEQA